MEKQRNISIDIMKGMAIILMVLAHFESLPNFWETCISSFHMPLFFLVAGYFSHNIEERSVSLLIEKLKKDFKRLVIPYLATIFLLLVYSFSIHYIYWSDHIEAWRTVVCSIAPTGMEVGSLCNSIPIWFLLALFWARTGWNLILITLRGGYRYAVAAIISLSLLYLKKFFSFDLPLALLPGLTCLVYMAIGYFFKQFQSHFKWQWLAIFVIFWEREFHANSVSIISSYYRYVLPGVIAAIGGTLACYSCSYVLEKCRCVPLVSYISKYLDWVGINSMVFLCAHTIDRYIPVLAFLHIENDCLLFVTKILYCTIFTLLCQKVEITRRIFQLKK